MAKDPMISGNILLKNELREEMGGTPTTHINATKETVGQYRARMRGHSTAKCSRSSRNDLVDLCSSEEEKDEKEKKVEKVRKLKR